MAAAKRTKELSHQLSSCIDTRQFESVASQVLCSGRLMHYKCSVAFNIALNDLRLYTLIVASKLS